MSSLLAAPLRRLPGEAAPEVDGRVEASRAAALPSAMASSVLSREACGPGRFAPDTVFAVRYGPKKWRATSAGLESHHSNPYLTETPQ